MCDDHPVSDDGVDLLLRAADVTGPSVGPVEVDRIAACVVDDGLRDELVSAVLETCDAVWDGGAPLASDELGTRIGAWRLDLDRAAVRSGLLTAVLAGALVRQGLTQMLIGVVAALVSAVLDVERSGRTAAGRQWVLPLRPHPAVVAGALSEDALYERLPSATRDAVNRLEFADLVLRLREVGQAGPDSEVAVRDPDGPPVRFSWR